MLVFIELFAFVISIYSGPIVLTNRNLQLNMVKIHAILQCWGHIPFSNVRVKGCHSCLVQSPSTMIWPVQRTRQYILSTGKSTMVWNQLNLLLHVDPLWLNWETVFTLFSSLSCLNTQTSWIGFSFLFLSAEPRMKIRSLCVMEDTRALPIQQAVRHPANTQSFFLILV